MTDPLPPRRRLHLHGRAAIVASAVGLLVVGGGAGAVAVATSRPSVTMAPAVPVAIRSLADDSIVTVKGRVAEVYGNKFILADPSGRALVETGRAGEDGKLVAAGQPVTVQGRFEHGFIHAAFLVGADGKIAAIGPMGGPPHDRHGPGGPGGPGPDRGPDRDGPGRGGPGGPDRDGPAAGPVAPPPAPSAATAPAAARPAG